MGGRDMIPSLPAMMEEGLRNQKDDWGDDRLHVSDLSVYLDDGKCPRELWLRLNGYEKRELTAGQMLMFDHGHRIHERIVDIIEKPLLNQGWYIVDVEMPIKITALKDGAEVSIKGRADIVLQHEEGMEVVVDFKTLRGRAFQYLEQPKEAHVLQVQSYMAGVEAYEGIIFYLDREGQNAARQFIVYRDDMKVTGAVKYAKSIEEMSEPPEALPPKVEIRKNKGPDSVYLKLPWQCDYCQYRDVSCIGAIPRKFRDLGVVGKIDAENNFKPNVEKQEQDFVLWAIFNYLKEAV